MPALGGRPGTRLSLTFGSRTAEHPFLSPAGDADAEFIPDWFAHQVLLVPSAPASSGRNHSRRAWPGNYGTRICGIERQRITRRRMTLQGLRRASQPSRSWRPGSGGP